MSVRAAEIATRRHGGGGNAAAAMRRRGNAAAANVAKAETGSRGRTRETRAYIRVCSRQ